MKKLIKIAAVIFAAALFSAAFTACSNNAQDNKPSNSGSSDVETTEKNATAAAGEPETKVFGWVKLDVPAGYTAADNGSEISVVNESDNKISVIVARETLTATNQSIDEIVSREISNSGGKYSQATDVPFGDRMWKMVQHQDNGANNRIFYAPAGDGANYLKVSACGLTENDDDVRTILASLTVL